MQRPGAWSFARQPRRRVREAGNGRGVCGLKRRSRRAWCRHQAVIALRTSLRTNPRRMLKWGAQGAQGREGRWARKARRGVHFMANRVRILLTCGVLWDQEVAGSNPAAPTRNAKPRRHLRRRGFCLVQRLCEHSANISAYARIRHGSDASDTAVDRLRDRPRKKR